MLSLTVVQKYTEKGNIIRVQCITVKNKQLVTQEQQEVSGHVAQINVMRNGVIVHCSWSTAHRD